MYCIRARSSNSTKITCFESKLPNYSIIKISHSTVYSYIKTGVLVITVSIAAGLLVMVSSELVVLLIVCVGINTGSAQQPSEIVTHSHQLQLNHCTLSTAPCRDETDRKCNFNGAFDTNTTICVSTTLNCVNSKCTAVINNTVPRECQFVNIGANVSQPIHCCLCSTSETVPLMGKLLWDCNITTPSSLLTLNINSVK